MPSVLDRTAHSAGPVPNNATISSPLGFLDTDITQGSGNQIVAGDVLKVINYINAGELQGGEREANSLIIGAESSSDPSLDALILLLATDISPRRISR